MDGLERATGYGEFVRTQTHPGVRGSAGDLPSQGLGPRRNGVARAVPRIPPENTADDPIEPLIREQILTDTGGAERNAVRVVRRGDGIPQDCVMDRGGDPRRPHVRTRLGNRLGGGKTDEIPRLGARLQMALILQQLIRLDRGGHADPILSADAVSY